MRDKEKQRIYNKAYRAAHLEGIRAKKAVWGKEYRAAHREEITAYERAWYAEHREEQKKKSKIYHATHPERKRTYYLAHKEEIAAKNKAYRTIHKDELATKKSAHYYANREKYQARERRHHYGISQEDFKRMLENQGDSCAICKKKGWNGKGPAVDHDHTTGKVRSLLCVKCNAALGQIGDDPNLALALARYLNRHKGLSDGVA